MLSRTTAAPGVWSETLIALTRTPAAASPFGRRIPPFTMPVPVCDLAGQGIAKRKISKRQFNLVFFMIVTLDHLLQRAFCKADNPCGLCAARPSPSPSAAIRKSQSSSLDTTRIVPQSDQQCPAFECHLDVSNRHPGEVHRNDPRGQHPQP